MESKDELVFVDFFFHPIPNIFATPFCFLDLFLKIQILIFISLFLLDGIKVPYFGKLQ
jgi:hypothetical protein